MWTTVLLLAIAVNFEPTRIGLVPLLLSRQRPMLQLMAFLAGGLTMTLGFGILILFVFHRNPFGTSSSGGGKAQIAIGVLALLIACFMAARWWWARRKQTPADGPPESAASRRVDKFTDSVRNVLRKGRSPWLSTLVGIGTGLPSVDYLAVLVIIATSRTPPMEQLAALVTFVLLGSLVMMTPLIGYLVAPAKTLELIDRFAAWTRSRSQLEYAGLLALIGCVLIGLGSTHL